MPAHLTLVPRSSYLQPHASTHPAVISDTHLHATYASSVPCHKLLSWLFSLPFSLTALAPLCLCPYLTTDGEPVMFINIEDYLYYNGGRRKHNEMFRAIMAHFRWGGMACVSMFVCAEGRSACCSSPAPINSQPLLTSNISLLPVVGEHTTLQLGQPCHAFAPHPHVHAHNSTPLPPLPTPTSQVEPGLRACEPHPPQQAGQGRPPALGQGRVARQGLLAWGRGVWRQMVQLRVCGA